MENNFPEYMYAFFALIFVLGLVALLALIARKFGLGFPVIGRANPQRRLSISEMLPIDAKRRLILLSRDGKEHLILMGADSSILIEANINPPLDAFETVQKETTNRLSESNKELR